MYFLRYGAKCQEGFSFGILISRIHRLDNRPNLSDICTEARPYGVCDGVQLTGDPLAILQGRGERRISALGRLRRAAHREAAGNRLSRNNLPGNRLSRNNLSGNRLGGMKRGPRLTYTRREVLFSGLRNHRRLSAGGTRKGRGQALAFGRLGTSGLEIWGCVCTM